jgi:hypothetical protein
MKNKISSKERAELQHLNSKIRQKIKIEHYEKDYNNAVAKEETIVNDDILENFNMQLSQNEPIKELVNIQNIKLKTNVTDEQRMALVVLNSYYEYSKKLGLELTVLGQILSEFIVLAPSVDGKRSEQFVDAHKAFVQNQQMQQQNNNQLNNVKNNAIQQ